MTRRLVSELENMIPKLVALGEDEKELKYWLLIFDILSEDEQEILMRNLNAVLDEKTKIGQGN